MKPLSELVSGYPLDHPQTLAELLHAPRDAVSSEVAWEVRAQVVDAMRRQEAHFVNTPWDVLTLAASGYVFHPWEKAWVSYAVDQRRQVLSVEGHSGYVRKATKLLPKSEELPNIPRGSSWLVMYGGDPSVLSKDGVVAGLTKLGRKSNLADVTFFRKGGDHGAPTLWSVRAGVGMSGTSKAFSQEVPFPDTAASAALKESLWTP